jgi:hypothetical protein
MPAQVSVPTKRCRQPFGRKIRPAVSLRSAVDQTEPLVSLTPSFEGHQHWLCPYPAFGFVALPQVLFHLFIPCGNWRGGFFAVHGLCLSTFLPPFAPRELPRFFATMAALTPARSRRNGFLPAQVSTLPYDTFPAFPPQPSPTARFSPLYEKCERKRIWLWPLASPLVRRLAAVANRIGFTFVWDHKSASGCSPPRLTTTQLPLAALPLLVSG